MSHGTSHYSYTIPAAPADRLPVEGETIFSRARYADYKVDADTGCWVWQKALLRGYPQSGNVKPHRVYYERASGTIPKGFDVHHKCETPACVNPGHLEALHYSVHRTTHKRSKSLLTAEQVAEIRTLVGLTAKQIAARYGCGVSTVQNIRAGINWKGVGADRPEVHCAECGVLITEGYRNRKFCAPKCQHRFNAKKPDQVAKKAERQRRARAAKRAASSSSSHGQTL